MDKIIDGLSCGMRDFHKNVCKLSGMTGELKDIIENLPESVASEVYDYVEDFYYNLSSNPYFCHQGSQIIEVYLDKLQSRFSWIGDNSM